MAKHPIRKADELSGWRKSSYSGNEAGSCLEVRDDHPAGIPVRDSKVPDGPVLFVSAVSWSVFVGAVKDGDPRS
ncbi:DUF397 domain-containing protein [Streptomyces sp. NPDC059785]|uniref:DUF397 domain-containing protein n=1 Tax=unclassified Streptomyces TaxID=2593676 RepID=UPI003667F137